MHLCLQPQMQLEYTGTTNRSRKKIMKEQCLQTKVSGIQCDLPVTRVSFNTSNMSYSLGDFLSCEPRSHLILSVARTSQSALILCTNKCITHTNSSFIFLLCNKETGKLIYMLFTTLSKQQSLQINVQKTLSLGLMIITYLIQEMRFRASQDKCFAKLG